jgi:hypothetical protein
LSSQGFELSAAGANVSLHLFDFAAAVTNHHQFVFSVAFLVGDSPVMPVIGYKLPEKRHNYLFHSIIGFPARCKGFAITVPIKGGG